jgi:hypothetical protein
MANVVTFEGDQIRFAFLSRNGHVAFRTDRIKGAIRIGAVRERAQILTRGGHGEIPLRKKFDETSLAIVFSGNQAKTAFLGCLSAPVRRCWVWHSSAPEHHMWMAMGMALSSFC